MAVLPVSFNERTWDCYGIPSALSSTLSGHLVQETLGRLYVSLTTQPDLHLDTGKRMRYATRCLCAWYMIGLQRLDSKGDLS
jgi:hypothetical protein